MNKLMQLFERSRNWLESGALASFLSNPVVRYDVHAGAHVVVIAIDVSPSMEQSDYHPTRLEGAKQAVRRYLDSLVRYESPNLVGVVDFHGVPSVISHPLPVGDHHSELVGSLARLHTGSGTNIGAALQLAGRELSCVPSPRNPTVILLTDGDSNQGPNQVEVASRLKARGVEIAIIGIGGSPADVNEYDLKRMASVINDDQLRYWFIDSADKLVERFEALALREIK